MHFVQDKRLNTVCISKF